MLSTFLKDYDVVLGQKLCPESVEQFIEKNQDETEIFHEQENISDDNYSDPTEKIVHLNSLVAHKKYLY